MIIAVNFQIYSIGKKKPEQIRASTGFEPVTCAIPVRCSTNVKNDRRSKFSNLSNWKEEAWLLLSNCLTDWKIYCDDHSSL